MTDLQKLTLSGSSNFITIGGAYHGLCRLFIKKEPVGLPALYSRRAFVVVLPLYKFNSLPFLSCSIHDFSSHASSLGPLFLLSPFPASCASFRLFFSKNVMDHDFRRRKCPFINIFETGIAFMCFRSVLPKTPHLKGTLLEKSHAAAAAWLLFYSVRFAFLSSRGHRCNARTLAGLLHRR